MPNLNRLTDADLDGLLQAIQTERDRRTQAPLEPPRPRTLSPGEFMLKHGAGRQTIEVDGRPVTIAVEPLNHELKRDVGQCLLPSGALMVVSDLGLTMVEPSPDPLTRLQARKEYASRAVQRAERHFQELRAALGPGASSAFHWVQSGWGDGWLYGDPPDTGNRARDGLTALRQIAEVVAHWRSILAQAEAELEALPQVKRQRAAEQQLAREEAMRKAHEARLQAENERDLAAIQI